MIKFWQHKGLLNYLLLPLSLIYFLGSWLKFNLTSPKKVNAKVICVGNVIAGGAGKTPLAIALGKMLKTRKKRIAYVLRGYKGSLSSDIPVRVDANHRAAQVGDEALLLYKIAPTYIAINRYNAAKLAVQDGAEVIIMDDGLQNNTLKKDISILVIDGRQGLGNNLVIPAGPLREPLSAILKKSDLIFFYNKKLPINFTQVYQGRLGVESNHLKSKKYVALCAIGNPDKFFITLKEIGVNIAGKFVFPDHHNFSQSEIAAVIECAKSNRCQIITTSKDFVRLPNTIDKKLFEILEVSTEMPRSFTSEILKRLKNC